METQGFSLKLEEIYDARFRLILSAAKRVFFVQVFSVECQCNIPWMEVCLKTNRVWI